MRRFVLIVSVLLIVFPFAASAVEQSKETRKISVQGTAENTVEPESAIIHFEVKFVRKEMSQSHSELLRNLEILSVQFKTLGLDEKTMKRSLVFQGPEYSWEKDSRVLKGYYSQCFVDLTVSDITKLSGVFFALAKHKSITIYSTDYERSDKFELRKTEYEKALHAARKKAEFMAQALGAKIGKVLTIQEVSSEYGDVSTFANVARLGDTDRPGYGSIKISARVAVEFELE